MPHISKSLIKASYKGDDKASHGLKPGVTAYEQAYDDVFVAGQVGNCYSYLLKAHLPRQEEAACSTGAGALIMMSI